MGKKGLVLFALTVVYNLASVLFANLFEPSVFLGIGLFIIWFLYGIWDKKVLRVVSLLEDLVHRDFLVILFWEQRLSKLSPSACGVTPFGFL